MPVSLLGQMGLMGLGAALGIGTGAINDKRQIKQQEKLQAMQIKGNKELTDYQMNKQLQMWKDTNYSAQMDELRKAGLNPGLIYGMGGGGGQTTGTPGAGVSGADAPKGGGEIMAGMGLAMQKAQIDLMQAQAEKTKVEATKIGGPDTDNVKQDTANKILQGLILDVTGKDMTSKWKEVTEPSRMIEGKTIQDELTARQGVAGTIYELWLEGKLKEKSLEEIEQLVAGNAKTRAEKRKIEDEIDLIKANTKGKDLENIITELETKLQTETGIDRNAPTWLKILGRLFVTLMKD